MATFPLRDLDADTVIYLRRARELGVKNNAAVLIDSVLKPTEFFVFLGLVGLALCGLCWRGFASGATGVFLVASLLAVALPLPALISKYRNPLYLGEFELVDGAFWWKVTPLSVETADISGVVRLLEGDTSVRMVLKDGTQVQRDLSTPATARRVIAFLGGMSVCNTRLVDEVTQRFLAFPGLRGRLAYIFMNELPAPPESFEPLLGDKIPLPNASKSQSINVVATVGVATVLIGLFLGFVVLPPVADRQLDLEKWNRTSQIRTLDAVADYLRIYPRGRFRDQALALKDDLEFERARGETNASKRITMLRKYIGSAGTPRHRDEAIALMDGYYGKAIETVKARSKADSLMTEGLVCLLESLKTAKSPIVYVHFESMCEPQPVSEKDKQAEAATVSRYCSRNPVLAKMHDPVIPLGDTFSPEQVKRRESVILERMRATFATILDGDLIDLRATHDEKAAGILIKCLIVPTGSFYLYTKNEDLAGMLRGYHMGWQVEIRVAGLDKKCMRTTRSEPLEQLKMRSAGKEPAWSPYAVMMYSGFHDFSARLLSGFGLDPPPSPNEFTFEDATGKHVEDPVELPKGKSSGGSEKKPRG